MERPGRIAAAPDKLVHSFDLPFEVKEFHLMTHHGVMAEDYNGSGAYWETTAWSATAERAQELADALVDWQGGAHRVQVWKHGLVVNELPTLVYQRDAADDHPPLPRRPDDAPVTGRPDDPDDTLTTEPSWRVPEKPGFPLPLYALLVWNATGDWDTIGWFEGGRTPIAVAAARLRIGVDGAPYPFGYVSGPNYPRAAGHDWTQEGRCCADRYPDVSVQEYQERHHGAQSRR